MSQVQKKWIADDAIDNTKLDLTDDYNFSGNIEVVNTPAGGTSAVNKNYVLSVIDGLDVKDSCVAASTADMSGTYVGTPTFTLTNDGAQVAINVDGIDLEVGERVLLKNQTDAKQNGIYTVTTVGNGSTNWVLTRASDFDDSTKISAGAFTFIEEGYTLADTGWVVSSDDPIILDTNDIDWTQFSAAGTYTAGDGLNLSGTEFSVDPYDGANPNYAPVRVGPSGVAVEVDGTTIISTAGVLSAAGTSQQREIHTVSSGEVTAGYFTLTGTPTPVKSVVITPKGGPEQLNKQLSGTNPDFDVLSTNQIHINNNGAATGLSEIIGENDVLLIGFTGSAS